MTLKYDRPHSGAALVVLSGGQDSTYCLAWARARFLSVHAITFNYGQHHAIELQAAATVGKMYGVATHEFLTFPPDVLHSTSPLVNDGAKLETYKDAAHMAAVIGDRVEKTFVPMRNMLFLTVAANRAVALRCEAIVTGICENDGANYPDCTRLFRDRLNDAVDASLGAYPLTILAPLLGMSKAEMIVDAVFHAELRQSQIMKAWAYSHTAYDGYYPPTGADHASLLRAESFRLAQVPDPLVLRAVKEGAMPLPKAENYPQNLEEVDAFLKAWHCLPLLPHTNTAL